jgi:hypothetical protein
MQGAASLGVTDRVELPGPQQYGGKPGIEAIGRRPAATDIEPRAGVGMRYLKQLRDRLGRQDGSAPDATGVLLGIYYLSCWSRTYRDED